jgi:hypothetical protein
VQQDGGPGEQGGLNEEDESGEEDDLGQWSEEEDYLNDTEEESVDEDAENTERWMPILRDEEEDRELRLNIKLLQHGDLVSSPH